MRKVSMLIVVFLFLITSSVYGNGIEFKEYKIIKVNINNKPINSDVPSILIDNTTYTPLRALSESLDIDISWDDETYTVNLTRKDVSDAIIRNITEYSPEGNYFYFDRIRVENWDVEFDEYGIPKTKFRWGDHYYPITIAHYGLQHYSLYLQSNDIQNLEKFLKVADYFLSTQDDKGGWPVYFDHMFFKGRTEIIESPWYSAMGQGQVMSVLIRAYHLSQNEKYLDSAIHGLDLFTVPVEDGGILTLFEGEYPWYEEYPTNPSSFVLNGFVFSLIGLYDVYQATKDNLAKTLYEDGVNSLERMISLFDLGNRTAYDLTHYTTKGNPPNVARWGYHSTHIHCLMTLNAIEKNPIFDKIIERWLDYADGKPTKTN